MLEDEHFTCPPVREFIVQVTITSIEKGKPQFWEEESLEPINEPFFI